MKKILSVLTMVIAVALNVFAQEKVDSSKSIKYYEGKLKISSFELRLVLKIYEKEDKSFVAYLDSPDQGAKDIPVSYFHIDNDSIKFAVNNLRANYGGKIIKDSSIVKGTFTQAGMSQPLVLKKVDKLEELKRPQTPQKPYPYIEEEVTFENKEANISLAGTITIPKGDGKYPAVVMVTGSGAQDRDETIFLHKPFMVIADYLTRNGIAVLRYDDRGFGKSKGNFSKSTTVDFSTDALAAIEYLKTRNEINSKKLGIIGHSEGGLIAPMCAVNSKDVSFIVMLAGPGVSGKEILIKQSELILRSQGKKEEEIKKSVSENKRVYDIVSEDADSLTMYNKLEKLFEEDTAKLSDEEKKKPENSIENFKQSAKAVLSPWFRFFIKYNPREALEQLTIPVLALNGERDLQVDPKQNLPVINNALKAAGNKNYETVELPGLNHLFQPCTTGGVNEYGKIETTFSEDALKIIKDWILKTTK